MTTTPASADASTHDDKYRPPVEQRTHRDRTEPVRIDVRTKWLYSEERPGEPGCICCEGRHVFSTGGHVARSDVPAPYSHMDAIADHVHRAIRQFGDDADLVIEVRRRDTSDTSDGTPATA